MNQTLTESKGKLAHLLTKAETAEVLGMCERSVEMAVARRALAVVRFGRRCIRFRSEDVIRFIESRRLKAVGEEAAY